MDDLQLEPSPFVNLVRRESCPLVVTNEQGQPFVEGKDFAELRDPKMGMVPYAGSFDVYHEPPTLSLPPGSRVKDGDRLRVSFYHAVTIHDGQIPCSLSEPKVFDIFRDQVQRVEKLFAPTTYFLNHDEIRVANWSARDQQAGKTAGRLLADNVRRCVEIVREVKPSARIAIWSDMFDPHHNAVKNYYLVNGDLTGSWEGLPSDVLIMNWNSGKAAQSLPFFAQRGHQQLLAGYYDGPPNRIQRWLTTAGPQNRVVGVMYTTWKSQYRDLQAFAEETWGKSAASDISK